jgi:hypothetical protein
MPAIQSRCCTLALLLTILAAACTDSGPRSVNIAGSWLGGADFGGTQSVTTRMTLTQTGTAISGTIRATGALPGAGVPITGVVDVNNRTFTWAAADGCESWGGVLNIDEQHTGMSGAIVIDVSGCPSGSNSSGTLTMAKE